MVHRYLYHSVPQQKGPFSGKDQKVAANHLLHGVHRLRARITVIYALFLLLSANSVVYVSFTTLFQDDVARYAGEE